MSRRRAPDTASAPQRRLPAAHWLGALGLVVVVVGTFLPWLSSGRTSRNSYQASGALQRLLAPDGIVHLAVVIWPFVSLACALAIACYALGVRPLAWLIAVLAAATAAAVAVAALSVAGTIIAQPMTTGPTVTLIGSVLTLLAAIIRFGSFVRDTWSHS